MDWRNPQVVLTAIGVAVAFLYTVVTIFIWYATWQNTRATRQVLEASHRPYIGVMNTEIGGQMMGEVILGVSIQNVGTVPSRNVEMDFELWVAGALVRNIEGSDKPIALFPGQKFTASLEFSDAEIGYINGEFDVVAKIRYQGMTNKKYTTSCTCHHKDVVHGFSMSSSTFD